MGYLMQIIYVFFWPIVVIGTIFLALLLFSWGKLFEKVDIDGYKALIPLYNLYLLLNIAELPIFMIPILLIPGINIIAFWIMSFRVGERFGKKRSFQVGMSLLPFIFYPILSLSDCIYKEDEQGDVRDEDRNTMMYHQFPGVAVDEVISEVDSPIQTENQTVSSVSLEPKANIVEESSPSLGIVEEPVDTDIILDIDNEDSTWQDKKKLTEAEETLKVVTIDPLKDDPLFNPGAKPVKVASLDHYKTCPNCGARLDVDAEICFLCGKQIEEKGK